jgi:hypothetical protein
MLSKDIQIWCGEGVMKTYREDFVKASVLEWIFGSLSVQARMDLYNGVHPKNTYLGELQSQKRITKIKPHTASLDILVSITVRMECTDVRDHISAVLSLLSPEER